MQKALLDLAAAYRLHSRPSGYTGVTFLNNATRTGTPKGQRHAQKARAQWKLNLPNTYITKNAHA